MDLRVDELIRLPEPENGRALLSRSMYGLMGDDHDFAGDVMMDRWGVPPELARLIMFIHDVRALSLANIAPTITRVREDLILMGFRMAVETGTIPSVRDVVKRLERQRPRPTDFHVLSSESVVEWQREDTWNARSDSPAGVVGAREVPALANRGTYTHRLALRGGERMRRMFTDLVPAGKVDIVVASLFETESLVRYVDAVLDDALEGEPETQPRNLPSLPPLKERYRAAGGPYPSREVLVTLGLAEALSDMMKRREDGRFSVTALAIERGDVPLIVAITTDEAPRSLRDLESLTNYYTFTVMMRVHARERARAEEMRDDGLDFMSDEECNSDCDTDCDECHGSDGDVEM